MDIVALAKAPLKIAVTIADSTLMVIDGSVQMARASLNASAHAVLGESPASSGQFELAGRLAALLQQDRALGLIARPGGPLEQFTRRGGALERAARPGGVLDRLTVPGGPADRLFEPDGFLERALEPGGIVDRLTERNGLLDRLLPAVEQLADTADNLQNAAKSLGAATTAIGGVTSMIPGKLFGRGPTPAVIPPVEPAG